MCGIAGFSLTENSSVNARSLAHNLLAQIEARGQMSAGFAFGQNGRIGYHKAAVAGSNLRLKGLPRDAKTVILHTRFATHGPASDNDNNHPVLSPDKRIALVHNGVIWNHEAVRHNNLSEFKKGLPEVDTSVIPALLQKFGTDGVQHMSGDAAVAWLDADSPSVLNLARLESSPVAFTQLADGSIVFASLEFLLVEALNRSGLSHGAVMTMDERAYFQLQYGHIIKVDETPAMLQYSANERWWSNATSGGHGSESRKAYVPRTAWSEDDDADADAWTQAETDALWNSDHDSVATKRSRERIAMAFLSDPSDDYSPSGDDAYFGGEGVDLFYTVDQDGGFKTYRTLDALETDLLWHASKADDDNKEAMFGAEGMSRWMEYFMDVGAFDEDGGLISWVDEPGEIGYYDQDSNDGLSYIRDGANILTRMVGM